MPLHFIADKLFQILQLTLTHLDPELMSPLDAHQEKKVCIHLTHFPPLYFVIEKDGLHLLNTAPEHCDTTFEGSLSAFLEMIFNKKPHTKGLHIRGDMECAKAIYDTWQHFDVDFEHQLAKVLGGPLAHTLCQSLRQGHAWFLKTWQDRKHDLGNYLQNEHAILVSPLEMEAFLNEVARLRHDVERVAIKINHLQQRIDKR